MYPIRRLVIISPFVGALKGGRVTLEALCAKLEQKHIRAYFITRKPDDDDHQQAVDILKACDLVELRYNESLHAKLYVCLFDDDALSFALLGSGNLTRHSIDKNIEIAMMIYAREHGKVIIRELSKWGLERMRTLSSTKLEKRMSYIRR